MKTSLSSNRAPARTHVLGLSSASRHAGFRFARATGAAILLGILCACASSPETTGEDAQDLRHHGSESGGTEPPRTKPSASGHDGGSKDSGVPSKPPTRDTGADRGSSSKESGADEAHVFADAQGVLPSVEPDAGAPSYIYAGCPVFGPNGWFDTDVSSVAPDPNSSAYIQATVEAGDTGSFSVFVPPSEHINLATPATPLLSVQQQVSWHPFPFQVPWASTFFIEPASDAHSMVVQGDDCHLYEFWSTSYSGGVFTAYCGADWDLTKPFVASTEFGATGSGLPLTALMVKPGELASGVISHSLGWDAVGGEGQNTVGQNYVLPAASSGGLAYSGPSGDLPMPYGSHIRLKASYDDSGYPSAAKSVTTALKRYGAYLYDTGCCDNIPFTDDDTGSVSTYWSSADSSAIGGIHITDFDVIPPGAN